MTGLNDRRHTQIQGRMIRSCCAGRYSWCDTRSGAYPRARSRHVRLICDWMNVGRSELPQYDSVRREQQQVSYADFLGWWRPSPMTQLTSYRHCRWPTSAHSDSSTEHSHSLNGQCDSLHLCDSACYSLHGPPRFCLLAPALGRAYR